MQPTVNELLRVVAAPVLVALVIAGLGKWRKWKWAFPLAAGVGFLLGYGLLGVPKLRPADGNDWLFWLILPATGLAVIDSVIGGAWGWLLAIATGAASWVLLLPLIPGGVISHDAIQLSLLLAGAGLLLALCASWTNRRLGAWPMAWSLCITLGAAAVLLMCTNIRTAGIRAVAASAALGPVALLIGRTGSARSITLYALPMLAGVLTIGRYYPDPGITPEQFWLFAAAPLCVPLASLIPTGRRRWIAGILGILLTASVVGVITSQAAVKAQHDATQSSTDADPYK